MQVSFYEPLSVVRKCLYTCVRGTDAFGTIGGVERYLGLKDSRCYWVFRAHLAALATDTAH